MGISLEKWTQRSNMKPREYYNEQNDVMFKRNMKLDA